MNRMFRLATLTFAAGALALVIGLGSAGAARSSNSVTYQDSIGEDPAAPDIQTIVVSNDDNGMLTFAIHTPNVTGFTGKMEATVFLDTDNNATDGAGANYDGAEMALDLAGGSVDVGRWDGSGFSFSGGSPSSLTYGFSNGVLTIQVKASDLNLSSFNFWVATDSDSSDPNSHIDEAPDPGHGTFAYEVKITPPAPVVAPKTTTHPKAPPKCKKGQKSTKAHPCHK